MHRMLKYSHSHSHPHFYFCIIFRTDLSRLLTVAPAAAWTSACFKYHYLQVRVAMTNMQIMWSLLINFKTICCKAAKVLFYYIEMNYCEKIVVMIHYISNKSGIIGPGSSYFHPFRVFTSSRRRYEIQWHRTYTTRISEITMCIHSSAYSNSS